MHSDEPTHVEALPAKRSGSGKRLKKLLLIGAILFAGFWGFKYFWLEHPVGSGPAGPPVPQEAFASAWSHRDVLLIGLGLKQAYSD